MAKKRSVDVAASLGYQANGRLKPADKEEFANKNVKIFICPQCNISKEISKLTFGENVICDECDEIMLQSHQ
jgi:uncharacterized paraquat-inducible protein A